MIRIRQTGMALLFGLGMALAGQSVAMADDASELKSELRQYQARVDTIKLANPSRYATEMTTIAEWIEQSIILLDKKETKQVKSLLVKTGVYLDYVETNMSKDDAMGKAMKAESDLKALKAEYGKVEAEVQQLEAEEAMLTKQLESLTKK